MNGELDVTPWPALPDCNHVNAALWANHFTWWCGNCGITVLDVDWASLPVKPRRGDLVGFGET